MYRVLDLFAGAGGLSLGFVQTGKYEVAVAVENDASSQNTYRRNHPGTKMLNDIMEITDYDLFRSQHGVFDVIIGGPPCQGFSNANRRKNHVINANNELLKKYIEVVDMMDPKAFVIENVLMVQSSTRRFLLTRADQELTDSLRLHVRPDTICLHRGACKLATVKNHLRDASVLGRMMLPESTLNCIHSLLTLSRNPTRRHVENIGRDVNKRINSLKLTSRDIPEDYRRFEDVALSIISRYAGGEVSFEAAEELFEDFLKVQQLFYKAKELLDRDAVVKDLIVSDGGVYAVVSSYSVSDYLMKRLGAKYDIASGGLNSATFGVPQLRERFIAIGIKKGLTDLPPALPNPVLKPSQFLTVRDAISDLENVRPRLDVAEVAVKLRGRNGDQTSALSHLRDSSKVFNHVVPETGKVALERFAALQQGQNFHDLDKSLRENTYAKPERTQNSIYLRLAYGSPSGTVINVRKSMWVHPVLNRGISIREAARLQSFPDSYVFVGVKNSQYQQVGNAVPPMMAKAIAEKVAELLASAM